MDSVIFVVIFSVWGGISGFGACLVNRERFIDRQKANTQISALWASIMFEVMFSLIAISIPPSDDAFWIPLVMCVVSIIPVVIVSYHLVKNIKPRPEQVAMIPPDDDLVINEA